MQEADIYGVEVDLKVKCKDDSCVNDLIKCRAYIKNIEGTLKIVDNDVQCEDTPSAENSDVSSLESTPIIETIELTHEMKTSDPYVSIVTFFHLIFQF